MPKKNYKKDIIKSAKKILAEKSYEELKMRMIAKEVGIKAASIYNHFASKEELLYQLIYEGRVLLANKLKRNIGDEKDPIEIIFKFFDTFIEFGFENKEYYKILFMTSYPDMSMSDVKDNIAREIEPGLKTLSKYIEKATILDADRSLTLAESFFHIVHGHISLSILERIDFLFDIDKTREKIREIIRVYINTIIK